MIIPPIWCLYLSMYLNNEVFFKVRTWSVHLYTDFSHFSHTTPSQNLCTDVISPLCTQTSPVVLVYTGRFLPDKEFQRTLDDFHIYVSTPQTSKHNIFLVEPPFPHTPNLLRFALHLFKPSLVNFIRLTFYYFYHRCRHLYPYLSFLHLFCKLYVLSYTEPLAYTPYHFTLFNSYFDIPTVSFLFLVDKYHP